MIHLHEFKKKWMNVHSFYSDPLPVSSKSDRQEMENSDTIDFIWLKNEVLNPWASEPLNLEPYEADSLHSRVFMR